MTGFFVGFSRDDDQPRIFSGGRKPFSAVQDIAVAVKNRFGAANELGVFAMTEGGMREVKNPSAIFLSARNLAVAGRTVTAIHQGSRPLLVEVQALTDRSGGAVPRRRARGRWRTKGTDDSPAGSSEG